MAKKKTENRHYVNNKEFLAAMTEYRTRYRVVLRKQEKHHPVYQTTLVSVLSRLQTTSHTNLTL